MERLAKYNQYKHNMTCSKLVSSMSNLIYWEDGALQFGRPFASRLRSWARQQWIATHQIRSRDWCIQLSSPIQATYVPSMNNNLMRLTNNEVLL